MCWYYDESVRLVKERGGVLVRQKKHDVWRMPDGTIQVFAQSPSDQGAFRNRYMELIVAFGLVDPNRGAPGVRRERRKPGRRAGGGHVSASAADVVPRDWRGQLRSAGSQLFGMKFDRRSVYSRDAGIVPSAAASHGRR